MFGSDWPVVELRSKYVQWVQIVKEILSVASPEQQDKVFRANALQFYKITV